MLDEADVTLTRLLLPDVPVLLDTSFQILAQGLFNEDPVCPQEADTQSNIQQEQTQQELHQLQQDSNTKFARIKALRRAHMSLSMVKQEVKSDICVKVFDRKEQKRLFR